MIEDFPRDTRLFNINVDKWSEKEQKILTNLPKKNCKFSIF